MKTNLTVQTYEVLNSMTRNELRSLAQSAGIPRGRDKKNTVAHLVRAVSDGKLHFKSLVSLTVPPVAPDSYGKTLFVKKFRSYKPDKTLVTPSHLLV